MQLLFAVIDDLYSFAISAILALLGVRRSAKGGYAGALGLPAPLHREALLAPAELEEKHEEDVEKFSAPHEQPTFTRIGELMVPDRRALMTTEKNTVMYAGSIDVSLYREPTQAFDGMIARITYGAMVMVLEQKGKFARVAHNGVEGWVLREDLADRAAHVYPDFVIGEKNELDDPNTIRLRAMIGDVFGGARVEYPLQAGEYVVYKLLRKGIEIAWPSVRPRLPGSWHTILKGVTGVHIGITPKTGSVMEYILPEEIGHVAYVEAVFPDETISISEANYPDSGIYNERVLTREEWRELRPVFIQVT